jgi:hypothetical protein
MIKKVYNPGVEHATANNLLSKRQRNLQITLNSSERNEILMVTKPLKRLQTDWSELFFVT